MIRRFKIFNKKYKEVQAFLTYDTETKQFSLRILKDYTGMHPDAAFDIMNKLGIFGDSGEIAHNWVMGRILPPDRQGLRGILDDLGIKEYDEFELLLASHGESHLDYSCIIEY